MVLVIVGPHQVGDATPLELGRLPVTFSHADSDQAEWKKWFQQQNCRMDKCLRHLLCAKSEKRQYKNQQQFLETLKTPGAKKNLVASIVFGKKALLQ